MRLLLGHPENVKRRTFVRQLYERAISDIANSTVKFDSKGDGLPRYTIYNYQKDETTGATDYKVIGKWHSELDMNVDDVMWTIDVAAGADEDLSTAAFEADSNLTLSAVTLMPPQTSTERASVSTLVPVSSSSAVSDGRSIPTSVCSLPCKAGEIMIMNTVSRPNKYVYLYI